MARKDFAKEMKAYVKTIDRRFLLPKSQSKGMGDFISKHFSNGLMYDEEWYSVIEVSDLEEGGYLKYNGHTPYLYLGAGASEEPWFRAKMEAYDKYLCTDGTIRFLDSEESRIKFDELSAKYDDEFWDDINLSFEAMGMRYDQEKGYWINPKTGEEGYY